MGMFDSLYDSNGHEWQTKAYDCILERFQIDQPMPHESLGTPLPDAYQVAVLGGPCGCHSEDSWATVRDHILVAVPAERDPSLPRVDYHGGPAMDWS